MSYCKLKVIIVLMLSLLLGTCLILPANAGIITGKTAQNNFSGDPLMKGLVGWWTFDGKDVTVNTTTDKSGLGNDGTRYDIVNAANISSRGPVAYAGKIGQALKFDGTSDFVSTTDSNSLDITVSTTLSAWVQQMEDSRNDTIISKGSYALKIGADSMPYMEMATGSEDFVSVGTPSIIYSYAVFRGRLYAGGSSGNVYRYEGGVTWTDIATLTGDVRALIVYKGSLYAGTDAGYVYRYNGGTSWTDTAPSQISGAVYALAVYDGQLYAGTDEASAYVFRYAGGTTWSDVDASMEGAVYAMAVYNGSLYAGGSGTTNDVWRYDGGTTWTGVAPLAASTILAMAVYDGKLFVCDQVPGGAYRYEGDTTWTNLQYWTACYSMAVYNNKLYFGGGDGDIYRYSDDQSVASIGDPGSAGDTVQAMAVYDGKLYIGQSGTSAYTIGAGKAVYSGFAVSSTLSHIAGTYDGFTAKLYVNGTVKASTTTPLALNFSNNIVPLLIGASRGSSGAGLGEDNFKGLIDDARVYNRALSAQEIYSLSKFGVAATNVTPAKKPPLSSSPIIKNLVGWWTFDGKDVTTATTTDKSGLDNDGTRYDTVVGSAPAKAPGPKTYGGKVGQALKFDGDGQFVSTTESSYLRVNTTTLSAWVRRSENSRMDSIMSKGSYSLKIGPDDKPFFEMATGSEAIVGRGNVSTADVHALVVYNGQLYVGTSETGAHVRRYDGGNTWTDVDDSMTGNVYSFAVYNGNLYAGSSETNAHVWRYDGGNTWTDVDSNMTATCIIYSLVVYNSQLYAGGDSGYVWRYEGSTTWTDLDPSFLPSNTYNLVVYNGELYVSVVGEGYVYRYGGGTTWTDVDTSIGAAPLSFAVYKGQLYVGTAEVNARVRRYDGGTTWTDVDSNISATVNFLTVYNDKLYAGAQGGYLWRYDDGTTWTDVDSSMDSVPYYNAFAVYDGRLFIGNYNSATNDVWSLGAGKTIYGTTTVSSTQWAHIAGSFDGSKMKIYVNGNLDNTTTTNAGSVVYSSNATQLLIGSSPGSSGAGIGEENFNGIIDDVRIYNKALTGKEIQQLAKSGVSTVAKTPGVSSNSPVDAMKKGLTGWWTFDAKDVTSASVLDKSGRGNTGTKNGLVRSYAGKIGQGIKLDGVDGSYISIDDAAIDTSGAHSYSVWAKATSLPGGKGLMGDWSNNDFGTMFYNQSVGDVCAYVDNTNKVCMTGISIGAWHHYALVDNGVNILAYLDGVYKGSTVSTGNDGNGLYVGTYAGGAAYVWPGIIDDARVYNRALSKQEIQQLYRMGR